MPQRATPHTLAGRPARPRGKILPHVLRVFVRNVAPPTRLCRSARLCNDGRVSAIDELLSRPSSRTRSRAEDDALTFHIALKYYVESKTAQEVADELRLERSFVSRRLKEARLRGMV